jgi:hypothetical protein
MNDAAATVGAWLAHLELGELQVAGALTLVAVHADAPPQESLAYQTLEQGLAAGTVVLTELPQATVPTLQVVNNSRLPLLLLDGEEVVGGRQNRVVNTTVLVPGQTTFDLDVTCVEHGRWYEAAPEFKTGEAVYPTLRGQKARQVAASLAASAGPRADQGVVWDEVANRQYAAHTIAPTNALHDLYLQRDAELVDAVRQFNLPEGAVGVIATLNGRARCADVFDRPSTLRAYWSRLVRSYALETSGPGVRPDTALGSALRLLSRARRAERQPFPSAGLGGDVRLSGSGITGAALTHAGVVVHTAVFRQAFRLL